MVEMVTSLYLGEVALRYVQRTVREDSGNLVRNLIGMVSVGLCVLCLLSGLRHHRYFTGSDFGVERLTNTIHTNQRKPNQSNSGQQIFSESSRTDSFTYLDCLDVQSDENYLYFSDACFWCREARC